MTPQAMKRTLNRHLAYRRRAGEIGKEIKRILDGGVVLTSAELTRMRLYADELDPPGVVVASDGVISERGRP